MARIDKSLFTGIALYLKLVVSGVGFGRAERRTLAECRDIPCKHWEETDEQTFNWKEKATK